MNVLIIGGTGTLGHALVPRLLREGHNVTVFSREEIKQKKMASLYPECRYVLGDIRDYESLVPHCFGKTAVFHLAAMKHVDLAEVNLTECIKINLLGSMNVAKACLEAGVDYAVLSSTDKAVLPINAYGHCKALSERIFFDANGKGHTLFSVFRWGNVLGSRGSVLHAFTETLKKEKKVYITHFDMTRFWIHIEDAAAFMLSNYAFGNNNQVYIPPMKAAPLVALASATAQYLGVSDYKIESIPIRPGEKLHEWLDYHDPNFEMKSNNSEVYTDEELLGLVARTLDGK